MARKHFLDDEVAAEIVTRKAFDTEESAAYAADLDAQVEERGILEVAREATHLWEELREELQGRAPT
jgi:hypothetical protein